MSIAHVTLMKSYLHNTSTAINLSMTMVAPKQNPHGALQWQAFCLPNLGKTFQRGKIMDLSKNHSKYASK